MFNSILSLHINRSKILQALLVSSCLILFLCFFTPLEIFFSNTKEFDYLFNEVYPYLLLVSVSVIVPLTLVLILIPRFIFERVVSLFLVITVLLWVQGNLFNKDYGPLDGGKINWDRWATSGYVEAAIWLILIILAIIFSPFVKKIVNKASVVIFLTLICTFAIKYFQYSPVDKREVIFDESVKFDFSSNKNVILILLDEVQSDVFDEIISEHPEFKEQFSGFVYYPDTVAGFPFTETSVPNILTGTYYDNSVPFSKYVEKAYLGNSVPKVLKERDFQVDLIPTFYDDTILKSNTIASNLIRKGQITNFRKGLSDSLHLIDIAIFRNAPQLLKRYVIDDNKWFLSKFLSSDKSKKRLSHLNWWSGDDNFYGEFSKINNSVRVPVFKFFHLKGCHAPYNRNIAGQYVPSTRTRETYKNFVIYNLKRLVSFLDELKSKGIYDRSLIYIFGDHGAGRYKELKVDTELIGNNGFVNKATIPHKIKARAIPLLMTKHFSATGELTISSKPVSLGEIPQMVFKDLGMDMDGAGGDEYAPQNNPTRKYLFWNHPYTDPMYEYDIGGDGWLDSSWSGPARVYTGHGVYERYVSAIFENSNSRNYRIESSARAGTYKFEPSGKWGYSITIKQRNQRSRYFLSFILDNNIDLDDLDIDIKVNDRVLKTINVSENYHISEVPIFGVPIPTEYSPKGELNIYISYQGKAASHIQNPFESIYLFKLQRT